MSTDATEANKKLIASEAEWNPRRAWQAQDRRPGCPDACSNKSAPVRLEANKKYFVEAIFKDGRFGDNLAVTWIKSGEADPKDVSGRSNTAREGRIKCSHFEVTGFIALGAALAADRSDESTQSESATIDNNSG